MDWRRRDATTDPEGLQTLVEKTEEKIPTKVFIVALDKETLLGCVGLVWATQPQTLTRTVYVLLRRSPATSCGRGCSSVNGDTQLDASPRRRSGQRAWKRPARVSDTAWRFTGCRGRQPVKPTYLLTVMVTGQPAPGGLAQAAKPTPALCRRSQPAASERAASPQVAT